MGAKWKKTKQKQKQKKTEEAEGAGAMLVEKAEEESTSIIIHSQENTSEAILMAQHGRKTNKQRRVGG